jgi:hypothetical protein
MNLNVKYCDLMSERGIAEMAMARQQLGKHFPTAVDSQAAIGELLEAMFSVLLVPRLYNEDQRYKLVISKRHCPDQ